MSFERNLVHWSYISNCSVTSGWFSSFRIFKNKIFLYCWLIYLYLRIFPIFCFFLFRYFIPFNGRGEPFRWPCDILYPLKLALTSPTSGRRSVGIVRLRTTDNRVLFCFTAFCWETWIGLSIRRLSKWVAVQAKLWPLYWRTWMPYIPSNRTSLLSILILSFWLT
jgi:hypothetical protein